MLDRRDLRLDAAEIDELLGRIDRPDLPIDSAELLARTDGWAALVALFARSRSGPDVLGRPIARTHDGAAHAVALANESAYRYLTTEIVDQLEPEQRELLLDLAAFPAFTAEMATALAGRADTLARLARLHADHALVERHGEARFRIHDLLRELLVARARVDVARWNAVAVKAARLLAADDQVEAAFELLAGASAWPESGDLVEEHAAVLVRQGRIPALALALGRIPEEHRAARPWLAYWGAITELGRSGERARRLAERAFADFRGRGDSVGTLLAWAAVVQALVIESSFGPLPGWLALVDELVGDAPPSPPVALQVATAQVLGHAFADTTGPRALARAERALEIAGRYGSVEDRIHVAGAALLVFAVNGRIDRALDTRRLTREIAEASRGAPIARLAYLHAAALLDVWSGELRTAGAVIAEGIALATATGIHVWTGNLQIAGVLAALARKALDDAERLLDGMGMQLAEGAPAFARAQYAFGRAVLAFERDDVASAERWIGDARRFNGEDGFAFGTTQLELFSVALAGARGDPDRFAEALARLDVAARRLGSPLVDVACRLVRCYGRSCLGEEVTGDLGDALRQVRDAGAINPMFVGWRIMSRLVRLALEQELEIELVGKLVHAHEIVPTRDAVAIAAWPWSVRIRTLGTLAIEIDGKPVEFGRKLPTVPLALLKLLVAADEPVPAARLGAALWAAGAEPRGALDTALHRLRKLLGRDDAIETGPAGIALNGAVCWTDVRALAVCGEQLRALRDSADLAALDRCERLLFDCYRGQFGADDDPAAVLRSRPALERRFARTAADLVGRYEACGAHVRARAVAALARSRGSEATLG